MQTYDLEDLWLEDEELARHLTWLIENPCEVSFHDMVPMHGGPASIECGVAVYVAEKVVY